LTRQQKNVLEAGNRTRNNEPNGVRRIDLNGRLTEYCRDTISGHRASAVRRRVFREDAGADRDQEHTILPTPPRPNFLKPVPARQTACAWVEGQCTLIGYEDLTNCFNTFTPEMMAKEEPSLRVILS